MCLTTVFSSCFSKKVLCSGESYIKAYIKRNSQASYTICTRKDYQTRGEAF